MSIMGRIAMSPRVEGLIAGISCKDLSPANPKRPKTEKQAKDGSTASTYAGMLAYVTRCFPAWILLENSDQLVDANEHPLNMQKLNEDMQDRGYIVHACVLDSACYGAPQHRRRPCRS